MTDYNKPSDIDILWAQNGDISRPSTVKIQTGWVVEAPDRQFFNWLDNKQDAFIAYINQKGIPGWDNITEYVALKSHVVGSDGIIYRAIRDSVAANPVTSPLDWVKITDPSGYAYSKAEADARYAQRSANLSDLGNVATARSNLDVFSKGEADGRFVNVTGAETMAGPLTVTNGVVANVTGNASTASTLQTARTISLSGEVTGSTSFNGGNNVTITATVNADGKYYPRAEANSVFINASGDTMTGPLNVPVSPTASAHATAKQYVDNLFALAVPAGAVMAFATTFAPSGWLVANGATVGRATYPALFAAIGTTFGAGDGSTTFRLPDLRGEFIRGFDAGRGADAGRAFGSTQVDSVQNHTHSSRIRTDSSGPGDGHALFATANADEALVADGGNLFVDGMNSGNIAGETRPRNVAMLYCIKF